MRSNVDFTQINKKTYDITLKSGRKLNILPPTLSMLNDLNRMTEDHPIEFAYQLVCDIFNHNRNKAIISFDEIEQEYDGFDINAVIVDYTLFCTEILKDPN